MKSGLKLVAGLVASSAVITAGVALAASSPSVTTGRAHPVGTSSATLNGTINPNGNTAHYKFELGLTESYGVSIGAHKGVGGTKPVAVKLTAHHLLPGTVYHYRLDATNGAGSSVGVDRTFRMAGNPPPDAATGPATDVGTTVATVTGVINPHNEQTTYEFQYGISTDYKTETIPQTVPAGNKPVNVAVQLSGLSPGTTYFYRLVALHGSSVAQYGDSKAFFTRPSKPPAPAIQARTTPHRARRAPYVLTTSGKLVGPSSIPKYASCFGNALVRFYSGRHRVAATVVAIAPDCTFSGQTDFSRLPRHRRHHHKVRLKILIHFPGNGWLAAATARPEHVVLG